MDSRKRASNQHNLREKGNKGLKAQTKKVEIKSSAV
jgi:hypothetical protein